MVPQDSAGKAPYKAPLRQLDHNPETGEKLPEGQYWDVGKGKVFTRAAYDPAKHCGVPKPSANGEPCRQFKGANTNHVGWGWCSRHLGNTAGGMRVAKQEQLRAAVATYGLPIDIAPEQALLDEVQRTAGHVHWLGARIRALDPEGLVWGRLKTASGRGPQGPVQLTEEGAAIPVLLQLYQAERKHLISVCSAAINAGISQKALELAQGQATALVNELHWLIDRLTDKLKLSESRRDLVETLVGEMLRRMSQDADGPQLIAGEILALPTVPMPKEDADA